MKKTIIPVALIAMVTASCAGDNQLKKASETITPAELREYTRILSADSMMGRKPFTPGETITINYLAGELERTGFAPAFGDSWFRGGSDGGDQHNGTEPGSDHCRRQETGVLCT